MKKTIFVSLIILSMVYSCKKDTSSTNTSQVVGKWTLINEYDFTTFNTGVTKIDTLKYTSMGVLSEFKSDSTIITQELYSPGSYITTYGKFQIRNNTLYWMYLGNSQSGSVQSIDPFNIKTLSN